METKSPNTGAARQAASEEPQSSHRGTLTNPDPSRPALRRHRWIAPTLLMGALVAAGAGLAAWKINALGQSNAAAASQPEPVEVVTAATVRDREHRRTTTSIGTVVAMRSVTLRNELAGTVAAVDLTPGRIVEAGTLLVALDVSVEEAELKAQEAQAALAETLARRMERAVEGRATSQMELDRARAELDVAKAQIARTRAIIARKTIRAPFRARVGISDVHPGQYLNEGTLLTTLQGVDSAAHVDFEVPQQVAQWLKEGEKVEVLTGPAQEPVSATIVALDSRVDSVTRNTTVRARVSNVNQVPSPGASVRVRVPAGAPLTAASVPVSALRKGPAGDHVFVIAPDQEGKDRAQMRRVVTGPALGDDILIVSGLTKGEKVAAFGSFKLRESVLVAVAEQGARAENVN